MKSRGCYETPGGTLIYAAHRELEALTLDKTLAHYKQRLALDYAEMVYNGLWFTPLREALDAFFDGKRARRPPAKSRCGCTREAWSR
jgi:argininosuccinate synthase